MATRHLTRVDGACVECTACVAQCRSGALSIARPTYTVRLDVSRCSACGWCVDACGYGALELVPRRRRRAGAA